MDNRKDELLLEILRRVQRNCVRMVEIERLTKELGDALARNDQESAQLLMKMRQDEMERTAETRYEVRLLLESAEKEEQEKLRAWLNGKESYEPDCFEAKKIVELSDQMALVLNRTITLDKSINQKVAGKDSYYQKTK
ncbi:MAG: hypothetical protein HFH11_12770 [Dorea sp.]|jgi:hypothetical protein|nr:hypothetical protein [Dorea sp.]